MGGGVGENGGKRGRGEWEQKRKGTWAAYLQKKNTPVGWGVVVPCLNHPKTDKNNVRASAEADGKFHQQEYARAAGGQIKEEPRVDDGLKGKNIGVWQNRNEMRKSGQVKVRKGGRQERKGGGTETTT